ncbi:MAG: hypothetical protein QXP31_08875 [Pyrobaculum sp.]
MAEKVRVSSSFFTDVEVTYSGSLVRPEGAHYVAQHVSAVRLVKEGNLLVLDRGGRPVEVLSGLAEVAIWRDGGGRLVRLEVELLEPYAVDEEYVRRFLAELEW